MRGKVKRFMQMIAQPLELSTDDGRKRFIAICCLLPGIFSLIIISIINFLDADFIQVGINLIVIFCLSFLLYKLYKTKNAAGLLQITAGLLSLHFLILIVRHPEIVEAQALWIFLLPLLTFYLLGKTKGLIWTLGVGLCAFYLIHFMPFGGNRISFDFTIRFAISYFIISCISLVFEIMRENVLHYMSDKNAELTHANMRIKEFATTDPLTGVFNRAYLKDHLSGEIKRSIRYQTPLTIILSDIDKFKKVNDTYGHQIGDDVLKHFTACLKGLSRKGIDWIVRYGGEEFLIILPFTDLLGGHAIAKRFKEGVENIKIPNHRGDISITASFGLSQLGDEPTTSDDTAAALIHTADRCLYKAKDLGRNRIVYKI